MSWQYCVIFLLLNSLYNICAVNKEGVSICSRTTIVLPTHSIVFDHSLDKDKLNNFRYGPILKETTVFRQLDSILQEETIGCRYSVTKQHLQRIKFKQK